VAVFESPAERLLETVASQLPAEFLIGPDGTIDRAYYGKDIGDHLPIGEIDSWVESNQAT